MSKYLIQDGTGRIYGATDLLRQRADMRPYDGPLPEAPPEKGEKPAAKPAPPPVEEETLAPAEQEMTGPPMVPDDEVLESMGFDKLKDLVAAFGAPKPKSKSQARAFLQSVRDS